jgi:hypothetical protein
MKTTINGEWISRANNYMNNISLINRELEQEQSKRQRRQDIINFQRFTGTLQYPKRRHF